MKGHPMHNNPAFELPPLDATSQRFLQRMQAHLVVAIEEANGRLPFDRFMEIALYEPGLGYYVNGTRKFGEAGDFITAPEASPLFARCLARQCRQVLQATGGGAILEFGPGSGIMAADLLAELQRLGCLPESYQLLELSPELRQRQQEALRARVPDLLDRVRWLDHLPGPAFKGVMLGNEVLDAMPVHRFRIETRGCSEQFVTLRDDQLISVWDTPTSPGLNAAVQSIIDEIGHLPVGYRSEINLRLAPWLQALAGSLQQGALLLIDYGYSRREFYHPQRADGTLICHYRHRAYSEPLLLPGLADITANVDFTAVARAGVDAGFELAGFATQAHFLAANGLDELVMASDPSQMRDHLQLVQGVKTLTLPSEMGERFKVIGLTKALDLALTGFAMRDLRDRL